MYKFNCSNCEKVFHHKNHSAKYCCKECYYESLRGKQRKDLQKRITKECPVCGDDFVVRECHKHVKTCSMACGQKVRATKTWEIVDRIEKECVNCGEEFRVLPSFSEKKFCTHECYLDFRSQDVKYPSRLRFSGSGWQKIRQIVIKRDKKCKMCGGKGKHVHHKVPHSLTCDDSLDNLVLLCKSCHMFIHQIIRKAKEEGYKPYYGTDDEDGALLMLKAKKSVKDQEVIDNY